MALVTVVLWLAVLRLGWAFLRSELQWEYVAGHSRVDAPWYYRLAGVWGGSEGSLLLFAAVLAVGASVAAARAERASAVVLGAGSAGGIGLAGVVFASPFTRLDVPAVRGFGLTPILEHPAMAIHPPLLYAGLACSLAAAMAVVDGRSPTAWLRATLGLTTAAMALGGAWSYVEQGWGGYWAWDPVENTSLLVWLAALVALHAPSRRWLATVPWLLTLAGAALVRSGSTPSVHGFASQVAVGWILLAATVSSAVGVWCLLRCGQRGNAAPLPASRSRPGVESAPVDPVDPGAPRPAPTNHRLVPVVAGAAALVVVAAGTAFPVLADLFAARRGAVRGEFYARVLGPVAVVAVPFLVLRLRRPPARLAHAGMVLLCLGVAATTFDREEMAIVGDGVTVRAAGMEITGRGVAVEQGPRFDIEQVVATLEVDGTLMRPALVAYPERGGVLAETAVRPGLWQDVQVTLVDADDLGVVRVVVRRRPLMWLVWAGALLATVGALSPPRWRRRRGPVVELVSEPAAR